MSSSTRMRRRRACGARTARRPPHYTDILELDLATVEPSLAGPRRPQDRVSAASPPRASIARPPRKMAEERTQKNPQALGKAAVCTDGRSLRSQRRRRAHRRDHKLHQHFQSRRADWRRLAGTQRAPSRAHRQAVGEDQPCAGLTRSDRLPAEGRIAGRARSAGILYASATDAPPALVTRGPSSPKSPKRSGSRTSSPARCSPATAISRAACIRK